MSYEYNNNDVGVGPTTSSAVQMPITVFAPDDDAPIVNTANFGNEINFISDNREKFLSDDSEYYTTNSSGGLVYVDTNARTTTILNPGSGEISVYDDNTKRVTVYTGDKSTTGYSMPVNSSYDSNVGFSTEGTISNGNGASFPVNSGILQSFYTTNGVDLRDYSSSFTSMNSTMPLKGPGDSFATVSSVYSVNSSGEIVDGDSPSDFKQYFDMYGYGGPVDIDNYDTYTQFYELNQKLDVFGTLNKQFSNSIDTLTSENGKIGAAWGDISTEFSSIISNCENLFNVNGLGIESALEPLKESYSKAKTSVDDFLADVAAEYANVTAKKEEILAARAAAESATTTPPTTS